MTEFINRNRTGWVLLAITVVGFAVAVLCYSYLIASNCGAFEFLSSGRSFHTEAGC